MTNELYHYGIPGMKWGVRKYQNSDGSWTEEGLARRRRQKIFKYEFRQERSRTLPKGEVLWRMTTADEDISKNERTYVSDDPTIYADDYLYSSHNKDVYRDTYQTKEAVRVAGKQKLDQILEKVGERKLDAFDYFKDFDKNGGTNPDFAMGRTKQDREIFKKVKEQLKKEGYGAMVDVEDLQSLYPHTITPYIFIEDLLERTKHEKLSDI